MPTDIKSKNPKPPTARPTLAAVADLSPRLIEGDDCLRRAATALVEAREHFAAVWGPEWADACLPNLLDARIVIARARLHERQERKAARKGGAK